MSDIHLNFIGPFTFTGTEDSVFQAPCADAPGIYLWTIRQRSDNTHMIHYVGETTSLASRHREHMVQILGMNYGIFDADEAQGGVSELLWNGLWRDKSPEGPLKLIDAYPRLHEKVLLYLAILNIFFAELNVDRRLRKHIEGCIGWCVRHNHPGATVLYPDDNRVGTNKQQHGGELIVSSMEPIQVLDARISY